MSARGSIVRGRVIAVTTLLTLAGAGSGATANTPGTWTDLFAYPKSGQSLEQQTRDRNECHNWAVTQSGFDPARPPADTKDSAAKKENYLRAEGACLEARNYTVR